MLTPVLRGLLLAALLVPLASCGNSPQQPSDVVDDQSVVASNVDGTDTGAGAGSTDVRDLNALSGDPVVTGTVSSQPASLAGVVGRWVPSGSTCEEAGTSVEITETRFEAIERSCDIADAVDGNGSLTVGLRCTGADGNVDSELLKLTPTDTGLDLSLVGGDTGPQSLVRCP